jgi:hypothetical protein
MAKEQSANYDTSTAVIDSAVLLVCLVLVLLSVKYNRSISKSWSWSKLKDNVQFWVHILYVVAIIVSLLRIPLSAYLDPRVITITYNWAASLIICISSIVPIKLLGQKRSLKSMKGGNFPAILITGVIFVTAFAITIGLMFSVDLSVLLLIWRIIFCTSASIEILALVWCMILIRGSTVMSEYMWYVRVVCYQRVGIMATVIVRYLHLFDTENLKYIHMFLIVSGLAMFNHKVRHTHTCTAPNPQPPPRQVMVAMKNASLATVSLNSEIALSIDMQRL